MRSIGIPSPRVEGEQKVNGSAIYAEDVALPEMLWAKVLRSPIAHARIKKIDITEAVAEAALDLIDVEYEDLPVMTDPLRAAQPDAPLLHPEVAEYKGLLHKIETPSNVFVHLKWKKGEVEEGFRQSDEVIENTFIVPAVHQAYIEPHASLVRVNPDGGAEIWSSNKSPFALREQLGNTLQVPPSSL